jgi:hypothetical protein
MGSTPKPVITKLEDAPVKTSVMVRYSLCAPRLKGAYFISINTEEAGVVGFEIAPSSEKFVDGEDEKGSSISMLLILLLNT